MAEADISYTFGAWLIHISSFSTLILLKICHYFPHLQRWSHTHSLIVPSCDPLTSRFQSVGCQHIRFTARRWPLRTRSDTESIQCLFLSQNVPWTCLYPSFWRFHITTTPFVAAVANKWLLSTQRLDLWSNCMPSNYVDAIGCHLC